MPLSFTLDSCSISDAAIQFQWKFSSFSVILLIFKAPFLIQVSVTPVITSPLHNFGSSCITRFARWVVQSMVINEHSFSGMFVYGMSFIPLPFLSEASVTSTYGLDFLSHFFQES